MKRYLLVIKQCGLSLTEKESETKLKQYNTQDKIMVMFSSDDKSLVDSVAIALQKMTSNTSIVTVDTRML